MKRLSLFSLQRIGFTTATFLKPKKDLWQSDHHTQLIEQDTSTRKRRKETDVGVGQKERSHVIVHEILVIRELKVGHDLAYLCSFSENGYDQSG